MAVLPVWERKLKQEKGAERYASIRTQATSPVICTMLAMASSVHRVEDKAGHPKPNRTNSLRSLITLHLNTTAINKRVGVLTFFQIFCTNMKRGDEEVRYTQSESKTANAGDLSWTLFAQACLFSHCV
ncbi:Hypothetical predicted protein [Scomber scombrus]|uniref:Uncharacterized protein n=1 Tax=Scomber scombrus TaxID=13677 RepID=A0AAV1N054_SCOSC